MSLRSRLLAPLASALVGAVAVGLLTLAPAPVNAAPHTPEPPSKADGQTRSTARFARSSYLCYGYENCRAAGMNARGYASANDKMYWRMYSGHNCTNYAAYRMVQSGLPNQRPWSGGGNATYWGSSMARITDDVPTVGTVAWWKANTGPAGSAGHVAYVEQVVSSDEIIVSQDSWGGDFSWARITRSSGNWPSGFIHFNDPELVNKTAPVVSGVAKVGAVLNATAGTWSPQDAKVTYQWYASGTAIPNATRSTLKLGGARLGKLIRVRTTATKLGYPTKAATSAATAAVLPGALLSTSAPVISGVAKVDMTLSVDPGAWNVAPGATTIQWFAGGAEIPGATGATLKLTPEELAGRTITASVTASRAYYDPVTVSTTATAPVALGTIRTTRTPVVTGTAKPGQTLTLDPGAYRPIDADKVVQWLRDGVPVLNATGPTYRVSGIDLGGRISAQVTVTRSGYEPSVLTTPVTAPVRATPRLTIARERFKHRVRLTFSVTSAYVEDVSGTVVVRVAGGFRQEVTVRHGVARVGITDLPRGKRALRVTYTGGPTLERVLRTGFVFMP